MAQLKNYSDADYVYGVANNDRRMQHEMHRCMHAYFEAHKDRVFFKCSEADFKDIFQNAYIKLWENIEHGKVRVENGQLFNAKGSPFTSTLTTYFMAIAKNMNRERVRTEHSTSDFNEAEQGGAVVSETPPTDILVDTEGENDYMKNAMSDCLAIMSPRCYEVITKFYIEEKSLDVILLEIPSFTSKDALKTAKSKCMETLRKNAQELYRQRVNEC